MQLKWAHKFYLALSFFAFNQIGLASKQPFFHQTQNRSNRIIESQAESRQNRWLGNVFKKEKNTKQVVYRAKEDKPKIIRLGQKKSAPSALLGRAAFMNYVRGFEGRPYKYNTAGPRTFDCTGFITYILDQKGCLKPKINGRLNSGNIPSLLSSKSMKNCKPGDIIRVSGHAAFYVGPDSNDVYGAVGRGGGSKVTDHHQSGTCYQNPCFGS